MLRKLGVATALVAGTMTAITSQSVEVRAFGLWENSSGEVPKYEGPERQRGLWGTPHPADDSEIVSEVQEPKRQRGLWERSYRLPAENGSKAASALAEPRMSPQTAGVPEYSSTLAGTHYIVPRSPYLSTLGVGI